MLCINNNGRTMTEYYKDKAGLSIKIYEHRKNPYQSSETPDQRIKRYHRVWQEKNGTYIPSDHDAHRIDPAYCRYRKELLIAAIRGMRMHETTSSDDGWC